MENLYQNILKIDLINNNLQKNPFIIKLLSLIGKDEQYLSKLIENNLNINNSSLLLLQVILSIFKKNNLFLNIINKQNTNNNTIIENKINADNQLNNETSNLKNKIVELEKEIKNLKNQLSQVSPPEKDIELKEKGIKDFKSKLSYESENKEELMTVIFTSIDNKIHYAFICKNNDKFIEVENKLYDVYPEYKKSENYFTVNGINIIKSNTLAQNNIKNSDIIILHKYSINKKI